jgi:hypothetical protein
MQAKFRHSLTIGDRVPPLSRWSRDTNNERHMSCKIHLHARRSTSPP